MKVQTEKIRVMLVLDSKLTKKDIFQDCRNAVKAGIPCVQYREKEKSPEEMVSDCLRLKEICSGKALLFINDFPDVAFACGADGIHLGQCDCSVQDARELLPEAIIGVTASSLDEAKKAEADGADYVSASPVFATGTKSDAGAPIGLEMVKQIKDSVGIPVMAIGGINPENAKSVFDSGADAISVVSCIVATDDVFKSSKKLLEAVKK
ncbi:MAG: thiamine phosphate synthase [Candidatus Diapherotrites archaeon]|nr:thiamine phosphate synthase [Candidatus Diapherotrites archaeon]